MINLDIRCVYHHDLTNLERVAPRFPSRTELEKVTSFDARMFCPIRDISEQKRQQFDRRFTRGDACYIATLDGRPVHYSWIQLTGRHHVAPGRSWPVSPGSFWIFDCLTNAAARGLRIYPWVLSEILSEMSAVRGPERAFIYALRSNTASRRGIRRAGFTLTSMVATILLHGKRLPLPPLGHPKHQW